jgi:hypothetical protein
LSHTSTTPVHNFLNYFTFPFRIKGLKPNP